MIPTPGRPNSMPSNHLWLFTWNPHTTLGPMDWRMRSTQLHRLAAKAQFKVDDAKLQAQTMINAADDTEESQAEHALMEMGPKVVPVLEDAMSQADPGRRRPAAGSLRRFPAVAAGICPSALRAGRLQRVAPAVQ